jgi:hypothetical protein
LNNLSFGSPITAFFQLAPSVLAICPAVTRPAFFVCY